LERSNGFWSKAEFTLNLRPISIGPSRNPL
jgi:hypothetical protein